MSTAGIMLLRRTLGVAALAGLAAVSSGCVATVRTQAAYEVGGAAVVYDEAPVYEFETYPRTLYNGTYVYLVGDRWYARVGGRWAYYREEPPVLLRYRHDYYVHYGYREPPRYGMPPAYRGRYVAPAAYGRVEATAVVPRGRGERRAYDDEARRAPQERERAVPGYWSEPPTARPHERRKDKPQSRRPEEERAEHQRRID